MQYNYIGHICTHMHVQLYYYAHVLVDLQTAVPSSAATVISVEVLTAPSYRTTHTSSAHASSVVMYTVCWKSFLTGMRE